MSPGPPSEPGGGGRTATIVRYPNRRLYDRTQGRYVTLPEVVTMIRDGTAVTVRDSKTEKDLTATVLMQILLEFHPERMDVIPVPVLHLMIRANDVVLGFLRQYLRQSLTYLEFWQQVASYGSAGTPLDWMKAFLPAGATAPAPAPPAAVPPPGGASTEALARRVEELERRLATLGGAADAGEGSAARGESGG